MKHILIFGIMFILGIFIVCRIPLGNGENDNKTAEELSGETLEETKETPAIIIEETMKEQEIIPEETKLFDWQEVPVRDDSYMKELARKDLEEFRKVNPDVMGWIVIPGTQVDYPLMNGEDNDYYLEHTWDKKESTAGSICLEMLNNPDLRDFNTLIYGHRMKNETMFGSLKHYDSQEYFEEHPYVYILDDSGVYRYEIFSAYTAPVDGATFTYGFRSVEGMEKFLDFCIKKSVIDTDVIPTTDDKVLTLVTCTGRGYEARWVVQARLKGMEGNPYRLYGE